MKETIVARTNLAGVSMGDEVDDGTGKRIKIRQLALKYLKEQIEKARAERGRTPAVFLDLVPEPENPFDPDAVQVLTNIDKLGGRTQLGYLRNADTHCSFCLRDHPKFPTNPKTGTPQCPVCKRGDHLERRGLATRVAALMREKPRASFSALLLEVTGGTDVKGHYGCNVEIRYQEDDHG